MHFSLYNYEINFFGTYLKFEIFPVSVTHIPLVLSAPLVQARPSIPFRQKLLVLPWLRLNLENHDGLSSPEVQAFLEGHVVLQDQAILEIRSHHPPR